MNIQKNQIRAEIYLRGPAAKTFFGLLKKQQEEIEAALGYGLDWQVLPERQDSRIAVAAPSMLDRQRLARFHVPDDLVDLSAAQRALDAQNCGQPSPARPPDRSMQWPYAFARNARRGSRPFGHVG